MLALIAKLVATIMKRNRNHIIARFHMLRRDNLDTDRWCRGGLLYYNLKQVEVHV